MLKVYNYIIHLFSALISNLVLVKKVWAYNTLIKFSLANYKYSRYKIKLLNQNLNENTYKFCLGGAYEHFYSNYLRNINYEFIFIDIGSNIGLYSCIADTNRNCKKVISFEPIKSLCLSIKKNLKLNEVNGQVLNVGIYAKNSYKNIYFNPLHQGMSSLIKNNNKNFNKKIKCKFINYKKLDQIFKDNRNNHVVKIDVEGVEKIVIDQLLKSKIINFISSIFVEISNKSDLRLIKKKLKTKNFFLDKSVNIKFTKDYLFIKEFVK